jgi:basic membrane protein A and related proteins
MRRHVIRNYTGDTPAAWNDPTKGGEITRSQIEPGRGRRLSRGRRHRRGRAPGSGRRGQVRHRRRFQPELHASRQVLTSMLKRVDVAVYEAFMDAHNGDFSYGIQNLGLAEDGVGYALDEYNEDLITAEMREAVEEAKAGHHRRTIEVHDFSTDNTCPY